MLCRLFHRALFVLALIALVGDIELNPGYQTFDDMKTTRGLKIAHLNIRCLKNKWIPCVSKRNDNKSVVVPKNLTR